MKQHVAMLLLYGCALARASESSVSGHSRKIPPPPPPLRQATNTAKDEDRNQKQNDSNQSQKSEKGAVPPYGPLKRDPPPPPPLSSRRQPENGPARNGVAPPRRDDVSAGPATDAQGKDKDEDFKLLYTKHLVEDSIKVKPPPPPRRTGDDNQQDIQKRESKAQTSFGSPEAVDTWQQPPLTRSKDKQWDDARNGLNDYLKGQQKFPPPPRPPPRDDTTKGDVSPSELAGRRPYSHNVYEPGNTYRPLPPRPTEIISSKQDYGTSTGKEQQSVSGNAEQRDETQKTSEHPTQPAMKYDRQHDSILQPGSTYKERGDGAKIDYAIAQDRLQEAKADKLQSHDQSSKPEGRRTDELGKNTIGQNVRPTNEAAWQRPAAYDTYQTQPPQRSGYPDQAQSTQFRPPQNIPQGYYGYDTNRPPPAMQQQRGPPRVPPQARPPPRKPDPRQMYAQANARRREVAPPAAWKRIWRKIEGSLDGLADLEETIGGRARQLYSSTLETAAIKKVSPPFLNPRSKPATPSKPPTGPRNTQRPGADFVPHHRPQQPSISERVQRKAGVSAEQKMHGNRDERTMLEGDSRAINWDDVMHKKTRKVIRANGGASVPTEDSSADKSGPIEPPTRTLHPTGSVDSSEPKSQPLKHAFPPASINAIRRPPQTTGIKQSQNLAKSRFDDEDSLTWKEKLGGLLPSLPRFNFRSSSLNDYSSAIDAWKAEDEASIKARKGFLGLFARRDERTVPPSVYTKSPKESLSKTDNFPQTLASLGEKCDTAKPFVLLTAKDKTACISIGRKRALFDVAGILFLFLGLRVLPIYGGPISGSQPSSEYVSAAFSFFSDFMDSWSPLAFSAAILSFLSSALLFERDGKGLASVRRGATIEEFSYGRLFLRLYTSENSPKSIVRDVGSTGFEQVLAKIELARLRTVVSFVAVTVLYAAIRYIQPIFQAIGSASLQILELKELRHWPPQWKSLFSTLKSSTAPIFQLIASTAEDGFHAMRENPMRFAYEASIIISLFVASLLPLREATRKIVPLRNEEDEDDLVAENYERLSSHVEAMGTSSSTRLALLSESLEGLVERWRLARPPDVSERVIFRFHTTLRMCAYALLASAVLLAPLVVHSHVGIMPDMDHNQIIRWDSILDLAVVLYFVQSIVWKALARVFKVKTLESYIAGFLESVRVALQERTKQLESPPMGLQLQASISHAAGLSVRDVWAAHTSKRAWAVRGANFSCRNGEVLLVLGDESAGKTRLLTTVAESFLSPPKGASTLTRINRGSISLGGLDVSKWDGISLRKRVGVLLNDVRSCSDKAKVLSGLTMEEILDPFDGLRSVEPSHSPTRSERACITQALHITGLNSSLLPRLPSKMSTVVTANEEDLKPSAFNARSVLLSPVEWSKVLLTRVLSQAIFDNDITSHSGDNFENCLFGSLLLLDDVTAGLSETDEARLLKNLKQTGAAVVITSNRWATGRMADKIIVIRDGVIIESGTHTELLSRGAQKSVYASNWYAMTSMT